MGRSGRHCRVTRAAFEYDTTNPQNYSILQEDGETGDRRNILGRGWKRI